MKEELQIEDPSANHGDNIRSNSTGSFMFNDCANKIVKSLIIPTTSFKSIKV